MPEIGAICAEYGIWLHVDAAYAGAAAVCPELRWSHAGLEYADSYCFDPHKWLLTGFDCDAFWVADRAELIEALTVLPEFLRNAASESGAVIDYRDWQVPLGRRFRSLKLWFVLRWYGVEGLRAHIRSGWRWPNGSPNGSAPTTGSRWRRHTRSHWSASDCVPTTTPTRHCWPR
ncbi:pyridoxal-dependent decarboxylase [Micromonospora sp. M12]